MHAAAGRAGWRSQGGVAITRGFAQGFVPEIIAAPLGFNIDVAGRSLSGKGPILLGYRVQLIDILHLCVSARYGESAMRRSNLRTKSSVRRLL